MLTWRYRCLIKSSISKRTVFFFLVCGVNILHGMLCFPYSDHLMFSGPVYMRWASPVSRASPLNRDGSAFRSVYMIGVVWWWHLFARKYAVSNLLLTEILLSISIFRLAPDHVSTHNNLGTLLENNEVCPRNFKTLFLLKDKQLNPRPDSNPERAWVALSILQATETLGEPSKAIYWIFMWNPLAYCYDQQCWWRNCWFPSALFNKWPCSAPHESLCSLEDRARPFVEFFLETFLHTVTTIIVESGSFGRYRGTDYVQQKNQYNQTIKPARRTLWFGSFVSFMMTVTRGTCRNT